YTTLFRSRHRFEEIEVRRTRGQVERCRVRDRPARVVRTYGNVRRLGHRRNLAQFKYTPDVAYVGLDEVRAPELQEAAVVPPAVQAFASGDRNTDAPPNLRQGVDVVRRDW